MGGPPVMSAASNAPAPALPPPPPAGEGQTYCLRWNNHQTNLVQILHTLHEMGSYVDCTLVVDDEQFKAHRVVLAANSPYFQAILQDVHQDHCSILLPGVKGFEIAALLQYMYTGETTVTKSQEPEILRTAKELQVKGLYDNLMKFNHKLSTHEEHIAPYTASSTIPPPCGTVAHPATPYATSHDSPSSTAGIGAKVNGSDVVLPVSYNHNSSALISTSTNISPSAAISSSSSPPPYTGYQQAYSQLYRKSPGPAVIPSASAVAVAAAANEQTPTHTHTQTSVPAESATSEHGQWPLSPSAAAAAMLNSVYESAADMNPLKRKKLSAITSMFMQRDTPILRNVLAQANPADSSQPHNPLLLPGVFKSGDKSADKSAAANSSFNGSDYGSEKKYQDEPLSPHTDRSFDDEPGNNSGKKPEWKRYKQYTRNDMMCAIQCVREGMSALQASRKFGLPSRTLYDKVRKLNITTGRGTNRAPKQRSPQSVESSAAFPYSSHNYGQSESLHGGMHDERESKELTGTSSGGPGHYRSSSESVAGAHHMPSTISHSAAALLDHALLQQALENRGGDIAGREALHAMALAAAAHAAANRMSTSPGSNGHGAGGVGSGVRSTSPSPGRYGDARAQEMLMEHEREQQQLRHHHQSPALGEHDIKRELDERELDDRDAERDADDEDDHVEDLSVSRKKRSSPHAKRAPSYSPQRSESPMDTSGGGGVIMRRTNGSDEQEHDSLMHNAIIAKRELASSGAEDARRSSAD